MSYLPASRIHISTSDTKPKRSSNNRPSRYAVRRAITVPHTGELNNGRLKNNSSNRYLPLKMDGRASFQIIFVVPSGASIRYWLNTNAAVGYSSKAVVHFSRRVES